MTGPKKKPTWLEPFYPIFNSSQWLERLVPLGIKMVQLRIKDQAPDVIKAEIKRGLEVCHAHGAQLIVNDHWQEALKMGCDFIHLGQEDLVDADLKAIKAANLRLGISSHDLAELQQALSVDPDYIALGPVYPTTLKAMPWGPQGLPRLREWKSRMGPIPLVAIGGMSLERARGAFDHGADIVSVVSDITQNSDPEKRVIDWTRSFGLSQQREAH